MDSLDWEKPFPLARINRADLTAFGFTDEQIATVFTDKVMTEIAANMEESYHMNFGFWEDFRRAITMVLIANPLSHQDVQASGKEQRMMELLTEELRQQLPPLYSQEHVDDPLVVCKFFTPDSNWTWYVMEFDGEDLFFGLVVGFEKELGYFTLSELEEARGPLGLPIERDLHFQPMKLSEVRKEYGQ